jgi:hypothetical protein
MGERREGKGERAKERVHGRECKGEIAKESRQESTGE